MRSERKIVALGDLIEVTHGYAFSGDFINESSRGEILLTPGNFEVGGGFKQEKFKYYDGPIPEEYVLTEGDLIVTMTDLSKRADTLGLPAIVPAQKDTRRFLHNQRLGKVIIKNKDLIDKRYLFYLLCSHDYRNEVIASATGTTVKHTSPSRIHQFRFSLPSLPEQRRIAHILGTFDDKIELNRRMNTTLEAMARALFQSWFVDFDPVRAKMDGRWRKGESLPGLPAAWWHLFPDRLVDSELGPIPEGWRVGTLGEVAPLIISGDWGAEISESDADVEAFCIRGADIPGMQRGVIDKLPIRYLSKASVQKRQILHGDIVIETSGGSPTQSTGRVLWISNQQLSRLRHPVVTSNFCRLIRFSSLFMSTYIYNWFRYLYENNELFQYETGTTGIKNFNLSYFNSHHILCLPPIDSLHAFATQVTIISSRIQKSAGEADTLAQLRDQLLNRMLNESNK